MEQTAENDVIIAESQRMLGGLTRAWKKRRDSQGLKPGTVKHARAQLEYFLGAVKLYQITKDDEQAMPFSPMVLTLLSSGTDSYKHWGGLGD